MRVYASNVVSSICRRTSHFRPPLFQIGAASRVISVRRSDRSVIRTFDIGAAWIYVLLKDDLCGLKKEAQAALGNMLDFSVHKRWNSHDLGGERRVLLRCRQALSTS